jgi:hypothetical protein
VGLSPRRSRFFTVGLEAGYVELGTYDWESSTAQRGLRVEAEARLFTLSAVGTLRMPGRGGGPLALEFLGALGVAVPSGEERLEGRSYDYEFLRTTLLGRIGARGVWAFHDSWDLWLGAQFAVAPGAVRHTRAQPSWGEERVGNRERRSLTAVEPGLGVRYWFSL